jgi:hypothetical protein
MTYVMLTWYGSGVLDEVADHLSLDPAFEAHGDVTFRDAAGAWWRPQRDGSWLTWDATGWRRAKRPESLEGVAPLPMGIAASRPLAPPDEPAEPSDDVSAPAALVRCVDRVRLSYRSGDVTSTMTELILTDWMLLTAEGRLWTVGVQSGSWYAFGQHEWEPTNNPPAGPFVSGAGTSGLLRAIFARAAASSADRPALAAVTEREDRSAAGGGG